MTDISVVIASAETSILDVAKQASGLAVGLQNAAPSEKVLSNKSIQYLLDIAAQLFSLAEKCKKILSEETSKQGDLIFELANTALQEDKALREKHQIGDKFRFIRDRLNAVFETIKEAVNSLQKIKTANIAVISENEVPVYIYLFNAQGVNLQTWHKMVSPSVFYEHSVNRPVYLERAHIDSFIARKPNKNQHGYLTVIINKNDILQGEGMESLKDALDNPLIKVKEGAFQFNKRVSFTHNGHEYIVGENGSLIKKP